VIALPLPFIGFEVLTAVVIKTSIIWDIMHNVKHCCLLHAGFLLGLFFDPEYGGDIFLRNVA
jgi:hypothetical protein